MADPSEITAPASKALTALGAGAGTSMGALATNAGSFLPTDLAGWIALAASTAALVYTLGLLAEWWFKRVWRPFAVARGWLKPPKGARFVVDEDGNVSREDPA
jgi:hypothetical protein